MSHSTSLLIFVDVSHDTTRASIYQQFITDLTNMWDHGLKSSPNSPVWVKRQEIQSDIEDAIAKYNEVGCSATGWRSAPYGCLITVLVNGAWCWWSSGHISFGRGREEQGSGWPGAADDDGRKGTMGTRTGKVINKWSQFYCACVQSLWYVTCRIRQNTSNTV